MRTIAGRIILPGNAPATHADCILVEVRDVSVADAPSSVVKTQRLRKVALKPHGQIRFTITVPEVAANTTLSLRVHISLDGSCVLKTGDLLSTAHCPVPHIGTPGPIEVSVVVV